MDLSNSFLPYASFVAGLSGSLHCLGMCGGLVTASCSSGKDVLKYQIGRLLGYSFMGSVAWLMGYALKGIFSFAWAPMLSGLLLGGLFIFWGVQSFKGKKAELPMPNFLSKFYQQLFRRFVHGAGSFRSFIVGLISIMLPCGLIYGLIIAALALGSYEQVMISLLFFWLGTLPAMIGAPQVVKRLLEPFRKKMPQAYAIVFILVGVATIAGRLNFTAADKKENHSIHGPVHSCH